MINNLRNARRAKRLSQDDLAGRLNLSRGRVSQLESGPWPYLAPHLLTLVKVLECPPEAIISQGEAGAGSLPEVVAKVLSSSTSNGSIVLGPAQIDELKAAL